MNYLYISCLFLLFFFSLFNPLTCVSSKLGIGLCESQFKCGNITASFPFWGRNRPKLCGHPLLELRCIENITNLHISNYEYKVYHVDQPSNTIRLARKDQLGSFCGSRFNTTTSFPDIFELSPIYKTLNVLYNCDPTLSYSSSYSCPNIGRFSISQNLDYQYYCQDSFTVNVPSRFVLEERELDLSNLEGVLRKGFEMRLVIDERACQKCSSSGGICGFNSTTQICCNINSTSGGVSCLQQQPTGKELYDLCKYPFSCGGRNYLNYPFWIPGREECGHPDFKLNCTGGIAKIIISSVEFIISTGSWARYTLVRSDYMDTLFPRNPLDVKFDEKVVFFPFSVELLTIYYDCPSFSGSMSGSSYIRELDYGDDVRDYYVTKNLTSPLLNESRGLLNNLKVMCKRNVSIPSSGSGLETLQRNPTPYNLKHALEQGFNLSVNSECVTCLRSKGVCGYNHTSRAFVCYCKNGLHGRSRSNKRFIIAEVFIIVPTALCLLVGVIAIVVLLCPCFGVQISRKRKTADERRLKKLKALIPLKHYTYKQVKKITKSFAEVVGKGGFGIVYKGTLRDGRMVALKVLKDSKGNGEDFINEVASMSQTSHVNIVSLLGFCSEGSKRAIIYELLRNGSLDKFISDKTSRSMDLTTLYSVSLGVARGLDYLHFGCKTRIVHFDIKPQNVLLDENFCPKVSDFGLAKLCDKKESIMSLLETRGTIGYIAPEMISRVYGNISHKSDVYSYGMLVLEMIGARKKESFDQNSTSNTSTSTMYFPEWIYKDLEKEDNGRLIGNEINIEEEEITKKMTLVGLWCIQSSPSNRPTMNKVVEMMEGNSSALDVPPRPVLQEISMVSPFESSDNSAERSSASKILICSTNESV